MKNSKFYHFYLIAPLLVIGCEKEEPLVSPGTIEPLTATKGMATLHATTNITINIEGSSATMGGFAEHNMTLFKGNLWPVGGDNRTTLSWKFSSQVWFSKNGTDWKLMAKGIFEPRRNHSVLVYDNKLWVIEV